MAGPPFFRYGVVGDEDRAFDLEMGGPVGCAAPGDGRTIVGVIPAGSYTTLVHTGHPDRLLRSLTALREWVTNQGLALKNSSRGKDEVWGGRFESYLTDPAQQSDPKTWSTAEAVRG